MTRRPPWSPFPCRTTSPSLCQRRTWMALRACCFPSMTRTPTCSTWWGRSAWRGREVAPCAPEAGRRAAPPSPTASQTAAWGRWAAGQGQGRAGVPGHSLPVVSTVPRPAFLAPGEHPGPGFVRHPKLVPSQFWDQTRRHRGCFSVGVPWDLGWSRFSLGRNIL